MKSLTVYFTLCAFLVLTSCKKDKKLTTEAQVITNISFGADPAQKMDAYLPEGRNEQTPVVVMLHGGGFVAGDKADVSARAQQLSAQGFVVLNVNYRLVNIDGVLSNPIVHKPSPVKIADQLNDIQAAVNLAAAKSSEWRMSSDKWAIAGHSAGATLALLYAYGDKNTVGRVKVAANWAGATNFAFQDESEVALLDPRIVEVIYRAVGAEPVQANILAYMAASPMWLAIQGKALATINIRPEFNNVGDLPDGSKTEYDKFTQILTEKGVTNKRVEVAGADHGFSKAGNWDLVINETSAFFKARLQ
ncbi:alpha/beta hydrolase [Pedobacter frigoris]|uniref:Alpha/beta hydrolase n=1 Tax=Pedobacter frigoris TaxID=2571272 RepID=A0A4V5P0W5_9SPHI|nr:alpha/beta hydrolase [Pedobacter frigoris]TKC06968.1 alpha/beta hydrolase [Pedobacter frigoris]